MILIKFSNTYLIIISLINCKHFHFDTLGGEIGNGANVLNGFNKTQQIFSTVDTLYFANIMIILQLCWAKSKKVITL